MWADTQEDKGSPAVDTAYTGNLAKSPLETPCIDGDCWGRDSPCLNLTCHKHHLLDQRYLKADMHHLFFLILFNEGETKEDKEYCKQYYLKGGSQASNEEASKPSRLFPENNPKAAKPLPDNSKVINHG